MRRPGSQSQSLQPVVRLFVVCVVTISFLNFYFVYTSHPEEHAIESRFRHDAPAPIQPAESHPSPIKRETAALPEKKSEKTPVTSKEAPSVAPTLPKRQPLPRTTVERCVQQADESEICFYDGPVCYDGDKVVIFTETAVGEDKRSSMCYDFRHYEPSYTCNYGDNFGRPRLPDDTPMAVIRDVVPTITSYGVRPNSWGPNGKEVHFREEHPSLLTRAGLKARNVSILWLRPGVLESVNTLPEMEEARAADPASYKNPSEWIGPDARRASWASEDNADSLDALPDEGDSTSGLYMAGFHHSWLDHTWHGAAAVMQLWDVKRYNRTGAATPSSTVGEGMAKRALDRFTGKAWADDFAGQREGPGQPMKTTGAWAAPPMDTVLIAGGYRAVVGNYKNLMKWTIQLLTTITSNRTQFMFNAEWQKLGVASNRLVCARRSAILGYKPRLFNGPADAHAFRLASYGSLNLARNPKEEWPPRQITIVTRAGTRALANMEALMPLITSFGIPVRWITSMGSLDARGQIEAMADTGILIATHGAALANMMYLPAHAVVVEMFPYVMYGSMYRDLAAASNLFYYSIRSLRPSAEQAFLYHEEPFLRECDGDVWNATTAAGTAKIPMPPGQKIRHVSSSGAFLDYECNWRSKSSSLVLDPVELRYIMKQAVDDIGCREGVCDLGGGVYRRLEGGLREG